MKDILHEDRFGKVSGESKDFIASFDQEMEKRGYTCRRPVGDGFCWGKYMFIYESRNGRTKRNPARIYVRNDDSVSLRFYFSGIDKHRQYIESLPNAAKSIFTNDRGKCNRCKKTDACSFRKIYTIDGTVYEKCHGGDFVVDNPKSSDIGNYLSLITEFHPVRLK